MSKVQILRALLKQQLPADDEEERSELFARTTAEYEEELCGAEEENKPERELPGAVLHSHQGTGVRQLLAKGAEVPPEQQAWMSSQDEEEPGVHYIIKDEGAQMYSLDQEDPGVHQIKKEEEAWASSLNQEDPGVHQIKKEEEPWASSLNQEDPGVHHIKKEEAEIWMYEEQEALQMLDWKEPVGRDDSPVPKRFCYSQTSTSLLQSPSFHAPVSPSPLSWKTEEDPDAAPPVPHFQPARPPGPQLSSTSTYTPLDIFKLFFSEEAVQTLCQNTNKQAAKRISQGKKFKWTDLDVEEFYKYTGLLLYMGMIKLNGIKDYWRQGHLFSLTVPSEVMSRSRFQCISWNLYLSDPDEDVNNDRAKGTAQYDRLFKVKPLMDTLKNACRSVYHPHRELAVDERMAKAKTGVTQYMKAKPNKWGFKLFVLADSKNGYTVDFSVYTGKSDIPSGQSLSYNAVMSFIQPDFLGTGYHIYMGNLYSSPKLFRALHEQNFAACGTYRENQKDCPQTDVSALTKRPERGSIRWIRDGPIVYVKWMDTREVSVCSTVHAAYSGETVQRMVKQKDGWSEKLSIPCPTPVIQYNTHMGGVDHSDQFVHYYSAWHKTMQWYRNLFYHFVDIVTANSFILHKELCLAEQTQHMTHRAFMEQLTAELMDRPLYSTPARVPSGHLPTPITDVKVSGHRSKATTGRKKCDNCWNQGVRKDTPWKCPECEANLCLQVDRNCFAAWHDG